MAVDPSIVGYKEGGREACGVAENPGGDHQGVVGVAELPLGLDTPRVAELPKGDENPGVATKGEGVPREDGRGRGGDGTPPPTRSTEETKAGGGNEDMAHGPRTAVAPLPQRETAPDKDSAGPQLRQSDGANGARTKNGMHSRR